MRTIDQVREHLLYVLPDALEKQMMYGGIAWGLEVLLRFLLSEICFIDEREVELARAREQYLHGPRGAIGQFEYQNRFTIDFISELASCFAEVAFVLNYYTPARLLSPTESMAMADSLDPLFFERDWTASEIEDRFGPPSHHAGGHETSVNSYACADRNVRWIFFDFFRKYPGNDYDPKRGDNYFKSPKLRNVRLNGNKMRLLPFGYATQEKCPPLPDAENIRRIAIDPANVPKACRPLIPLAEVWGISDDTARWDILERNSPAAILHLQYSLRGFEEAIDEWPHGPEAKSKNRSPEYTAFLCMCLSAGEAGGVRRRQKS